MSKTHWKSQTNPNYLGEYSLPDGKDLIVTIDHVQKEVIVGEKGKKDEGVVAHLVGEHKPFILNKTNMKQITKLVGSPYLEEWRGRSIQIYFDPTVKFGRDTVGGLRIRPFPPELGVLCTDCGVIIDAANGKDADWVVKYTTKKYGKPLCAPCAAKAKEGASDKT